MDRRTDDWVLSALGAVIFAALVVMTGALVIALTDTHTTETQLVREPTPTPTIDATLAKRVNEILHAEEQVRFARLDRSPSPTPVPTPTGVPCTSDQLGADQTGSNGATGGQLFASITVANISGTPCDLPALQGIEALDESDMPIANFKVRFDDCVDKFICVTAAKLPLTPIDQRPIDAGYVPGTVSIMIGYSTGCWSRPSSECHPTWAGSLLLHFEGGLDVPTVLHRGVAWSGNGYPSVWGLGLVKPQR